MTDTGLRNAVGSLSVTYTNAFKIAVPQVLTVIPAPASASGALRVKVNGSLVKSVAVMPGRTNNVPDGTIIIVR